MDKQKSFAEGKKEGSSPLIPVPLRECQHVLAVDSRLDSVSPKIVRKVAKNFTERATCQQSPYDLFILDIVKLINTLIFVWSKQLERHNSLKELCGATLSLIFLLHHKEIDEERGAFARIYLKHLVMLFVW